MNRIKLISIFTLGALIVAAAFGAVAYRSASAAPSLQATATPSTAAVAPDNGEALGRGPGGGMRGGPKDGLKDGANDADLASALGITVEELSAARQTAYEAALTQAVEKGLITQTQADALKSDGSAFPFGDRWGDQLDQSGIDLEALLADALGITVEKLQEAHTQAFNTRIDQAVTDGTLTQEQADLMKGQRALTSNEDFRSSMQTAFEAAVKQAVTAGVITQAQADQILAAQDGKGLPGMRDFGGRGGPGDFGGHGGGRHGGGGGGFGMPPSPETTVTP